MIPRLAVTSIALALAACGGGQVDKVCTLNVKTAKSMDARDLKPEFETKTMVLTINEGAKFVTFNNIMFDNDKMWNYNGIIYADSRSNSDDAQAKFEKISRLEYHVKTGVLDFTGIFDFTDKQTRHHEREEVTMNGICK